MSAPIIAIVGPSGSGKSTSLRNLDPASTIVLDLELKGFPFKTAAGLRIVPCNNIAKYNEERKKAFEDQTCKTLVVESFTTYNEMSLTQAALVSNNDGFKTYAQLEQMTGAFFRNLKNDRVKVIVTAIDEIVKIPNVDGTENAVRRIATKGRSWEGKCEKEFLMVLFTQVVKTKEGKIEYNFQTNTDGNTSAKTPMGMFANQLVPNDMQMVLAKMEEYYK